MSWSSSAGRKPVHRVLEHHVAEVAVERPLQAGLVDRVAAAGFLGEPVALARERVGRYAGANLCHHAVDDAHAGLHQLALGVARPAPAHRCPPRIQEVAVVHGPHDPAPHEIAVHGCRVRIGAAQRIAAEIVHLVAGAVGEPDDRGNAAPAHNFGGTGGGGLGLGLARDEPLHDQRQRAARDIARLAKDVELARALDVLHRLDEVVLRPPVDVRAPFAQPVHVLAGQKVRADDGDRAGDPLLVERIRRALDRVLVPVPVFGGEPVRRLQQLVVCGAPAPGRHA